MKHSFNALRVLVLMNLDVHRRNILGLVMTLLIPLGLLVVYSFVYYISTATPALMIGYSRALTEGQKTSVAKLNTRGLDFRETDAAPETALRDQNFALFIGPSGNGGLAIYHKPAQVPLAALMQRALTAGTSPAVAASLQPIAGDTSSLAFLPGMLLMAIMNLALFAGGAKLLEDRALGTLRVLRGLPAATWLVFAADAACKFVFALLLAGLFLLLGILLLESRVLLDHALRTLIIAALSACCLLAFSYLLGASLPRYSSGIHVFTAANLVMIFLGDVIFPTSAFPAFRPIAAILPTTHCANLLRISMLGMTPTFSVTTSLLYIVLFTGGCAILTARSFSFHAKH